jgi:HK97 family phage major capsid protein
LIPVDCHAMSLQKLLAADDARNVRYTERIQGLTFSALVRSTSQQKHDVAIWRAASNILAAEWPDVGLPAPTAWWAPRRQDAARLMGQRALTAGSAVDGGNTIIGSAVTAIAEATRPRSVLERAGAVRREVGGVADAVALEWAGGSGSWVAENGAVSEAQIAVTSGAATPKTAGAFITLSRRLITQTTDLEADIAAEIQRLVLSTLESAFIAGTGTEGQPLGLVNTTGATAVPFATALPSYGEIVSMVQAYDAADGDPEAAAFFVNPVTFAGLLRGEIASGTGQVVGTASDGARLTAGIRTFVSNHVPAGKLVLGDPRNVSITYWRSPAVITNPYAGDIDGSVRITVLNSADILVIRRPQLIIGGLQ